MTIRDLFDDLAGAVRARVARREDARRGRAVARAYRLRAHRDPAAPAAFRAVAALYLAKADQHGAGGDPWRADAVRFLAAADDWAAARALWTQLAPATRAHRRSTSDAATLARLDTVPLTTTTERAGAIADVARLLPRQFDISHAPELRLGYDSEAAPEARWVATCGPHACEAAALDAALDALLGDLLQALALHARETRERTTEIDSLLRRLRGDDAAAPAAP